MNKIRQIEKLNAQELEAGVGITGSWHQDYKDSAYIYIGGLPPALTEGDIAVIFAQYGNPVHIKVVRDKDTGKSKGFAFLKYEDQRSTVLAVDNFNGIDLLGRKLLVDHTYYKTKESEEEWHEEQRMLLEDTEAEVEKAEGVKRIKTGEAGSGGTAGEQEEEDPMKAYFSSKESSRRKPRGSTREGHSKGHSKDNSKRNDSERHRHRDRDGGRDDKSHRRSHRSYKDKDKDKDKDRNREGHEAREAER